MSFEKIKALSLFKTPLFWAAAVLVLFAFCFVTSQEEEVSEFSLDITDKIDDLYLSGEKVFRSEYLSLNLLQGYFLKSLPSPSSVSPRVYGAVGLIEEREEPIEYVVQKGDTLQKISFKFYGTHHKWKKIYDVNKSGLKDPAKLYPGQKLKIPILSD